MWLSFLKNMQVAWIWRPVPNFSELNSVGTKIAIYLEEPCDNKIVNALLYLHNNNHN